jgi:endonuclease YncB( thermonuclease family)
MNSRNTLRSTYLVLALLGCLLGCSAENPPSETSSHCAVDGSSNLTTETVAVSHIYDGDTLTLSDGRKVRLIGVNAPELAQRGSSGGGSRGDQPYAQQAKQAVQDFVKKSSSLKMSLGADSKDRYGRWLGHMFNQAGESLEQELLQRGLAYHVAIPPNLSLADCFSRAEQKARDAQWGVWSDSGIPPVNVKVLNQGGFQRVQGRVTDVYTGKHWRLHLGNNLTVMLYSENQHRFDKSWFQALQGQTIEVQGWVYNVKGHWRIKLETPYGIEQL